MKLDDKYTQQSGSVYLTGMQALVRLPMDQMRRDRLANLNTAAFISGYEGSPLGTYDLALSRVPGLLKEHHIHFVPGVNEDTAATSVLGSQIYHVLGESKYDGVVGDEDGDECLRLGRNGTGGPRTAGDPHSARLRKGPRSAAAGSVHPDARV